MMLSPSVEVLNEQSCYEFLLNVLHPEGLKCPDGHPLPPGQAPHDRHRDPVFDYKCRVCGRVFNLFTGTLWNGTRYSCRKTVLILRGIMEGVPVTRLASQLHLDRSHLQKRRKAIEQLVAQYLTPLDSE